MERALQREGEMVEVQALCPLPSPSSLSSLEGWTEREMIKRWKPLKVQGRDALLSISRQSCRVLHVHYWKLPIFAPFRRERPKEVKTWWHNELLHNTFLLLLWWFWLWNKSKITAHCCNLNLISWKLCLYTTNLQQQKHTVKTLMLLFSIKMMKVQTTWIRV